MSEMRQFDWVPEEDLKKTDKKKPAKAYFAEGEANFCIDEVKDGFTADGNPKTMFILNIIDSNGKTGKYTVHASKSAAWQFMNIFNSIGSGIYRKGGYCDDEVLNKNGKLVFEDEHSEKYGVQSRIVKWMPYNRNDKTNPFNAGLPEKPKDDWEGFLGTSATDVELDDIPF